jgi:hypothetical protein
VEAIISDAMAGQLMAFCRSFFSALLSPTDRAIARIADAKEKKHKDVIGMLALSRTLEENGLNTQSNSTPESARGIPHFCELPASDQTG